MADQFLCKTRVASEDFVEAGGRPVLDRYTELRAVLLDRAGPEVADLFAEPLISRGNDSAPPTVAWYSDLSGDPVPLSRVSPAERDRITAYLSNHLRPLRGMTGDPEIEALAWGALSTYGGDDIYVLGDRPVIANWGLLPRGQGASVATRPSHFAANLGQYLDAPPRPAAFETSTPDAPQVEAGTQAPAAPVPPRRSLSTLAWLPLVVLLILAGGVLIWLLQPGTRLFPPKAPMISEAETLQAQQSHNADLVERAAVLQAALDGAVCRADGVLILPDGLTPEGLTPPAEGTAFAQQAQASPNAVLPTDADRVLVPGTEASADPGRLLDHIRDRTVLILAGGEGGLTAGSGFFIAPGLVLTNQHVIGAADPSSIVVAGTALGAPAPAEILKADGPLAETGGDFALLRIGATDHPVFAVLQSGTSLQLSNVIAAGYPGDVLEVDQDFAALRAGDGTALPPLTVTDGIVNTEQRIGPQTNVLMHSAPLSSGNSGGPLVDMCGRVVGVNSFVRKGPLQNRGYALAVTDLLKFLEGTAAAPTIVADPCVPTVLPRVAQSTPVAE